MIDSIKRMSLDLHNTTSNESVRVKRSDTGRKICISLVDGGTPYQITSDCYAVFTAKNAQGNAILHPCTIENNVIVYELKNQTTAVPGMLKCEVELYGADDKLITAPKFSILVEDKVYSDGDTEADEGEVSTLAGLIKDAASAISNANTAADNANDVAEELREARDNGEFDGDDYVLTDADKQNIAELAAGFVEIPTGGGFIASETPPEDTSVLWVDTNDNEGDEPPSGGSVELDTTLTVSGKAADAKSVGDALDGKISNRGTEERPYYNDLQLALLDDVPTNATLEHFIGNSLTQYDASIKQHIEGVANGAWNQVTEYVGTEIGKLAPLTGTTEEITPAQVLEALSQGRMVALSHNDEGVGTVAFNGFYATEGAVLANGLLPIDEAIISGTLIGAVDSAVWDFGVATIPSKEDIPTDDHINDLINTALGVIENATY